MGGCREALRKTSIFDFNLKLSCVLRRHNSLFNMALPAVFVTGGNAGIGAAICKQLVLDRGCKVFMGSRSVEKGENAMKEMGLGDKEGNISVVQCDVQSDASVKDAAAKVN